MDEPVVTRRSIPSFLADTCWFGMTKRLSDEQFLELIELRQRQGFTAIQIVVGIPPEVGPNNQNSMSPVGAAWNLKGEINYNYLEFAKERIKIVNNHGMTAIIYGAWGHQIDWIGVKNMCQWWDAILEFMDGLDVIYCLTGECDIWCNSLMVKSLLPDKTTDQLESKAPIINNMIRKLYNCMMSDMISSQYKKRRMNRWSYVLEYVSSRTIRPIIIHTTPDIEGLFAVKNPALLSANTFQTGHSRAAEKKIWELPYNSNLLYPNIPCVNLEPWYEGICDDFFQEYQLKAFWFSICSGVKAICYGAHGVWNVGDGTFLRRWGEQGFDVAMELGTPTILGKLFTMVKNAGVFDWNIIEVDMENGCLQSIARVSLDNKKIRYIPEIKNCSKIPSGKILDAYSCQFIQNLPETGSVVIFENL